MIIATICMTVPKDKRQEILQAVSTLATTMRKERGCKACDFYMDTEDADRFLLMQEWDTQDNFDRNVCATTFSALLGAMTLLIKRPDVKIHTVMNTVGMERIKAVRAA